MREQCILCCSTLKIQIVIKVWKIIIDKQRHNYHNICLTTGYGVYTEDTMTIEVNLTSSNCNYDFVSVILNISNKMREQGI